MMEKWIWACGIVYFVGLFLSLVAFAVDLLREEGALVRDLRNACEEKKETRLAVEAAQAGNVLWVAFIMISLWYSAVWFRYHRMIVRTALNLDLD